MGHNRAMKLFLIAALSVGALATAGPAPANPPDCVSPDGSPCMVVDGDGVSGEIPGGPAGSAGPQGASGSIPGGPSGEVGPGGASGCVPGVGCLDIPA